MTTSNQATSGETTAPVVQGTLVAVLAALTVSHLLNDMMQSVVFAIYPLLKESFHLSFAQIGTLTLANQLTASLLQPVVGLYTDRHPMPYSLGIGMAFTLAGLVLLATATSLWMLLVAVASVGVGSSVFHPEASRLARVASGGRHGLAQSVFQVGGNLGSSLGPLLAALIIVPRGQGAVGWFSAAALVAMVILFRVGSWHRRHRAEQAKLGPPAAIADSGLSAARVRASLGILGLLVFSKYFYLAGLSSYYTFYLIERFQVTTRSAQLHLFVFLFAVAAGTILGGPIGDRIGRKRVIWASILGVAPFTLALPYADLFWTGALSVVIGVILASAFSAILVYAQELVPGKVGMISGLFFGFAFGVAGIGAAVLGQLADQTGIEHVYRVCSFLPLIGVITVFLPDLGADRRRPA